MMNKRPNNILSYFIKDIKDATELAFYKQINHNNGIIQIVYKDELIYSLAEYCFNYINNTIKLRYSKFIFNSYIMYNYLHKYKNLYYNKDTNINFASPNFIRIYFNYNKYLNKSCFYYSINNNHVLFVSIINYNQYKYISFTYTYKKLIKYSKNLILIPNKYELSYYCKFLNLYFEDT